MSQFGNRFKDETLTQTALGTEIKISQASLAASWRRSSSFGLDPNGKPVDDVKSETEFLEITQKNEYIKQFVAPELELLYNQIAGTNFMVAYADSSGVVLDALLDEEFKTSDAGRAVIPGSIGQKITAARMPWGCACIRAPRKSLPAATIFFEN